MAKTRIEIQSDVFNDVYLPLLNDQRRYLVLYGGAGSGKSHFACQKVLIRLLNESGHRFLICRKVGKTLRNSVFQLFRDTISDWNLTSLFKINKSDMEITCLNGGQLLFAGLDDVEKLKSIARITGVWIEEASELQPGDFQQINLRLRGKTPSYKQIILSFNPITADSWLKTRFFDVVGRDDQTVLHTTYKDNRFLDADYVKVLEDLKNQDPYFYDVYCLGKWGSLGNLILTNWVIDATVSQQPSDYDAVSAGLDFGFNHPSAYLDVGIKDDVLCIFNEIYERGLTNTDLISRIKDQRIGTHEIVADSAEPDRILEFQRTHLRIRAAVKGPDSVKSGIDWLRRKKIRIHPSCVNTIKEIRSWKYKEDKQGDVLEEPVPFMDDAMAALRYAIEPWRTNKSIGPLKINLTTRINPWKGV